MFIAAVLMVTFVKKKKTGYSVLFIDCPNSKTFTNLDQLCYFSKCK